jgi:isopropylmalate/homocitrate/citramalate synthase
MSAPVLYFDVMRNMSNAFDYRLRLATHAHQHRVFAVACSIQLTTPPSFFS